MRRSPTPALAGQDPRRLRAARTGVAVVFGLNGLAVATWFARIPTARDDLSISAGRLGLVLLAMSAGAVLAMSTAGAAVHRLGPARVVVGSTALVAAGLTVTGLGVGAWASIPVTAAGLFALGYGSGSCDVAMNVEAAAVERKLARTVMPRFHAAWSLGTVAGGGLGAASAHAGMSIAAHLPVIAVVVLIGTVLGARAFLPTPADATPAGRTPADATHGDAGGGSGVLAAWREPRTLLVGLFVLVMAFTEGTANDWIGVAFVDGYGFSEAAGAAVFGLFVGAMTLGRLFGTVALDRWGRVPVLTATIGLAVGGVLLAVLAGSGLLGLIGVALWGVGASLGFPVGMSAAADDEDRAAARVSVVAMIGYTAFLAGPPLVGLLGDRFGTLRALLIVPVLLLAALLLVPAIRRPAPDDGP
ncbi:MFS transporter [Plantactinospora sp. GCM10030261]|uniref:MFS transporter n=1 Tax=Plantactinospora sp. GCM10030261 TaxID=3273420 RepID=UPI003615B773